MKKLITIILSMFLFSQALYSQPGWSPIFNESQGTFLGQATIDGVPAVAGDWVAAFDETTGNCTGAAELIIYEGLAYISMPIYGDDPTTEEDEGMNPGENFVLKLWDSSEDAILEYPTSFDCWYNNNGAPMQNECGDYTTVYNFSVPSLDPNFAVTLNASGGPSGDYPLTVGFSPNATDGFDAGFDSYAPPAPPPPAFDAALTWGGDRYYTQILNGSADDLVEHEYGIALAYPSDNLITITWDNTGWSDMMSSCVLQDAFGGLMINVDMLTENSLTLDQPAFNILKLKVTPTDYAEPPSTPPTAGFSYAVNQLAVSFADGSQAGDGAITGWYWDFGDGNSSTDENPPTHTYAAEGTYTVSLTVTDSNGLSDTYSENITVEEFVEPPSGDPNFSVSLNAADAMNPVGYDLTIGFSPNATDGFDAGFDSYAPPVPPPPAFDAALSWMGDRYYTQIVNGSADDLLEHVWDIQLAYPSDNLITLTWDNTGWSDLGTFALTDAFGGAMINIDMTQDNSLTLDNPALSTLQLKVTPLNDAPVLSDIGDQTTPEDVVLTVPIYANDVDSDSLNITATSDSPEDVNIEIEMFDSETVTDIDGNVYPTVQIGDQLWMKENLKVTHYNNGDEIQYVQSESSEPNVWENLSTGAYGYYNDDLSHQETYGNLYNWYAVETGNLAPEGWHVATDDEIKQLEMHLGMSQEEADGEGWRGTNEGSKLTGRADLWNDGSLENNPEFGTSGFNLLPGADRYNYDGSYYESLGLYGYFWSSTEHNSSNAWHRRLYYGYSEIYRNWDHKRNGFSVRCVRDVDYLTILNSDERKDEAHRDGNSRDDLLANLIITPSENFNGSVNIEVMVSDGFLTDTDDFILTITAVNDTPQIEPISDQVIDEDTELVLILSASDVDGDELFFDVYDLVPAWTYNISGNQLTLAPPPDFNGDEQVTVVAFDSSGAFTSTQFIVTVNPVNDAPTINLPMLFEFDEDDSLFSDFSGYLSDIEDDSLSLTVSGNVNITVDITGFDVTFGAPDNWYGTEMVWFTVNDNQNREIGSDSVDVNVLPVNDAPIVTVYPDATIMEDDTLTMMFSGTDIDGDSLSFSVAGPEDNPDITVSNFGEGFNVFASLNWYGDAEIRIDVWDGALADTAYFILTILPVNDAPVIEPISDQVIDEDTELVLILSASDIDGDEIVFDVHDLVPAWVYIILENQLTLVPPPDFIGDEQVTVVAYDSLGAFSSTQFIVTVNPVNDAPFFTMDSYSDIVGVTMLASIMLEADDIDSEGLEYGIYDHPDWITLDSNMVNILAPEVGTFTFGISVNDGELSTLDTIEIYVEEFRATITSVDDVPDDQGGYVYVNFEKSFYDTDGFDRDIEIYHVECFEDSNWVSVGSSAAYASESYSVRVSTILDSTSLDSAGFAYRVIASMDEGTFVSDLVSGYSVDNLSPGIPVNFTAEVEGQAITLSWDAADEDDFDHYNLYRSEDEGFAPHDSTLIATLMENSYVDEAIELNIVYAYKLSSVDIHENESEHTETVTAGILAADMGLSLPTVYALHYNHPNPFNPITSLRYDLPEQAKVTLTVYDLMGREVTQLVNTTQEPGFKSVRWNATDKTGKPVSAGVYLYQIQAGEFIQTKKMVLLK